MREILFRAKRTDNGEWIEGYYAKQSNHACFAHELKYQHFIFKDVCLDFNLGGLQGFEIIPETVGQYTGLTDKNGVKIFEGDILSAHLDEDNPDYETVVQVIWEEYGWRTMEENGLSDPLDDEDAEIFAIIGNIHDNPELLEGGEGNG